jgi:hypothetical protein
MIVLISLLAASQLAMDQDAVGPIRLGEPLRQVVAAFGHGTTISCKKQPSVSGSCDVLVEYSDGRDLLFLDFVERYGLALVRITQGAGADTTIARLPGNAGMLSDWHYLDFHAFDEKAMKAASEAHDEQQRTSKAFLGHFPAGLYRNKSGQLVFDLFEE